VVFFDIFDWGFVGLTVFLWFCVFVVVFSQALLIFSRWFSIKKFKKLKKKKVPPQPENGGFVSFLSYVKSKKSVLVGIGDFQSPKKSIFPKDQKRSMPIAYYLS
jgi:hypothetical protein